MSRSSLTKLSVVLVPAAVIAATIAVPLQASAGTSGSDTTAQQVVAMALKSHVDTFSGTVKQTSNLGLPDISGLALGGSGGSGPSDSQVSQVMELLTGSHTLRVFSDGGAKQRVQVIDSMAERDVVRNGHDVWLWNSRTKKATHAVLPSHAGTPSSRMIEGQNPAAVAKRFLIGAGTTTTVSLGKSVQVAGRDAYNLVITPKTAGTLVGSVRVAVDENNGQPLQVQVMAKGATAPAFQVGFSALNLSAPSASLFAFTPPKGAKVTTVAAPKHHHSTASIAKWKAAHPAQMAQAAAKKPTVSGSGWASVVTVPASSEVAKATSSKLFTSATTSVSGGRVLSTSLVNVLVLNDGRVLAGSVPVATLEATAASAATK